QGIYIQSCRLFHLQSNLLGENSRFGLRMSLSRAGNITENNIYDNGLAGANLVDCSDNLIYHNVFANNGLQNAADNGDNRWDGGSDMGGNYWSDFAASANPGVEPRPIAGGGRDRYPFRDAWGWQ
ncbi:MAG TPA: NosD domain-containing protein, partial [Methanothrix sp.]|nr:NosD domain-containing protein [Methanothrix sp.]